MILMFQKINIERFREKSEFNCFIAYNKVSYKEIIRQEDSIHNSKHYKIF